LVGEKATMAPKPMAMAIRASTAQSCQPEWALMRPAQAPCQGAVDQGVWIRRASLQFPALSMALTEKVTVYRFGILR